MQLRSKLRDTTIYIDIPRYTKIRGHPSWAVLNILKHSGKGSNADLESQAGTFRASQDGTGLLPSKRLRSETRIFQVSSSGPWEMKQETEPWKD